MRESAPGVSRAAPTPCSTRRAMSWVGCLGEGTQADATMNQATPTR